MNLREYVKALQLLELDMKGNQSLFVSSTTWVIFSKTVRDRRLRSLIKGYTSILMNYPVEKEVKQIAVGELELRTVQDYDKGLVIYANAIREYCQQTLIKAGTKS